MPLQSYLVKKFSSWQPSEAVCTSVTKRSVTLSWEQARFRFVKEGLLYTVQRKEKIPPWVTIYSGGKTSMTFHDLAPSTPYKFRLKVILSSSALPAFAEEALKFYGDEESIRDNIERDESDTWMNNEEKRDGSKKTDIKGDDNKTVDLNIKKLEAFNKEVDQKHLEQNTSKQYSESTTITTENGNKKDKPNVGIKHTKKHFSNPWLESQWSEETWTSTEFEGTSVICFCMSVRGGFIKQLQTMLEQRPELIELVNPTNGFTPLITAIMKGDANTVRFLLKAGAGVEQRSAAGHAPLHLAILTGREDIVQILMDRGASIESRDRCGLRVEHYAADSGSAPLVRLLARRGGDFTVRDSNGWTPLFRAVCQNASSELIEALVSVGSALDVTDACGLHLAAVARLMTDTQGRPRENVLRLLDAQFPRELALANFSRLTRKINRVHTIFRL